MRTGQPDRRKAAPGAVPASSFETARRMLRRQLDTLRRLGAAALRLVDEATRRVSPDVGGIAALEKAVRLHGKVG